MFGKDPAVRHVDALRDHGTKSQKQKAAVESEMLRRVSVFQRILDEKESCRDDILRAAFTALYWLTKYGMAYRNLPSLMKMLRLIGFERSISTMSPFGQHGRC